MWRRQQTALHNMTEANSSVVTAQYWCHLEIISFYIWNGRSILSTPFGQVNFCQWGLIFKGQLLCRWGGNFHSGCLLSPLKPSIEINEYSFTEKISYDCFTRFPNREWTNSLFMTSLSSARAQLEMNAGSSKFCWHKFDFCWWEISEFTAKIIPDVTVPTEGKWQKFI